jgi:hypothetical protein
MFLLFSRIFAPKCAACGEGITPVEGTSDTVRVVAMEKDFHVDCYVCEGCRMQLTDEPDKRCYPLQDHLFCRNCHIKSLINMGCNPTNELEVSYFIIIRLHNSFPKYISFNKSKL